MAHGKSLRQIKAEKKQASKEMHRANKEKKKAAREAQFPNGINPAGIRPRLIDVRDIVDWLRSQDDAPYPLATNAKVMRMWFEVMDAGVSMRNLDRRLAEVLDLWRTEGDPENSYTVEQQQNALAKDGPDMTPPVVTVTWQQFQQQKRLAQADPSAARPSTTDPSALDYSTADTAPPFAHGGLGASTVPSFVPDGLGAPLYPSAFPSATLQPHVSLYRNLDASTPEAGEMKTFAAVARPPQPLGPFDFLAYPGMQSSDLSGQTMSLPFRGYEAYAQRSSRSPNHRQIRRSRSPRRRQDERSRSPLLRRDEHQR
jgi:hypothetical protein